MSVLESPPQPGDDLDGLLRTFFRSQMPQPWPKPRLFALTPAPRRPAIGRSLMRSRWALAASIALLCFGSWLLPSRFATDARPERGAGAPVIGSDIRRDLHKDNKARRGLKKNHPGFAADVDDRPPEIDGADLPRLR